MFKPLIDALFDAVPVAWDMYSNFIYRLVTGRKFEDNIEVLEGDIMEVENIVKYEYIPTEEIKDMSKEACLAKKRRLSCHWAHRSFNRHWRKYGKSNGGKKG